MKIGDRVKVKGLSEGKGILVDFDTELGYKVTFDRDDLYKDCYYPIELLEVDVEISEKVENFIHLMETLDKLDDLKEFMCKDTYNCIKAKIYMKLDGGQFKNE